MRIVKILLPALLVATLFTSLSYAATPDRIAKTIDPSNVVTLQGHVTPMAKGEFDQGVVESSRVMKVSMLFLPTAQQNQALVKLLAEQQNIKSPKYHKWLTVAQYADQFGLSHGDVEKISAWLQGQGFKINYVANGRDYLSFEGTAGQVQSAFRTEIHNFNVNGKMHFANVRAPMIPAALSGIVGGFRGMHDFTPHSMVKKHGDYTFTVTGQGTFTALAPGDLATIYDINALYNGSPAITGAGQSVVIAGQSDVYLADLNDYRTAFGLSSINCTPDGSGVIRSCSTSNFEMVIPGDGSDPGPVAGDLGESDLDIEVMSAVARGAKIIFVTSSGNAGGVDDSASWAIDQSPPLANVISYSYGLCEAFVTAPSIAAAEVTYMKAAGLGISFFAASGDAGAATCDGDNGTYPAILGPSVSYPASSAYVTGVGGTEFNEGTGSYWASTNGTDGGSAQSYIPEIAWNDTALSVSQGGSFDATGGGPSNCASGTGETTVSGFAFEICSAPTAGGFPKPTWQTGITPADSVRDVPDISFSASNANDPYIVCVPQSEVGGSTSTSTCTSGISTALATYNSAFGGTSASTPLAAGMTVLLNQYLATSGLGAINQQVYTIYSSNVANEVSAGFHDITAGTNIVTGDTSDNIVSCVVGTPNFTGWPSALQCPAGGTFGSSAGTGYDMVTGLGTLDFDLFFQAWAKSVTNFTVAASALNPASVMAGNSTTSTIMIAPVNGFTGTVTLSCSGLPSGASCSFNPTTVSGGGGTTTLTISTLITTAAGTSTVTVNGAAGATTGSTTVSLTVTATNESFTLAPQNATYQVAQGTSATVNITLTPTNGFNTPVMYTCTDTISESTCTGPTGLQTATTVSFMVTTTAPTARLVRPFDRGMRIFYAALLPGLFGIMFTVGSRRRSLRGMRLLGLVCLLGFSTLWLGSCGGSTSSTKNPGTPVGTYMINISATTTTAGGNPVTGSVPVTITVVQ